MNDPEPSIVIPVHRSQETPRPPLERRLGVPGGAGRCCELVLVEDGGPDRSRDVLCAQLMRNDGRHDAPMCGLPAGARGGRRDHGRRPPGPARGDPRSRRRGRGGWIRSMHHPRASGRSGYSAGKPRVPALNPAASFPPPPLRAASACGILAAGGGFVLGACYLFGYSRSDIDVPGHASVIVAILVPGGMQLSSPGIMGEYLGRLHLNAGRKPQYRVRRVLAGTAGPPRRSRAHAPGRGVPESLVP